MNATELINVSMVFYRDKDDEETIDFYDKFLPGTEPEREIRENLHQFLFGCLISIRHLLLTEYVAGIDTRSRVAPKIVVKVEYDGKESTAEIECDEFATDSQTDAIRVLTVALLDVYEEVIAPWTNRVER